MDSSASTRPTSLTLSRMASSWAKAPLRSLRAAREDAEAGNSAEHHPPLRPEAPKPATSASQTAIRSPGSALAR
jgi:hypothetical protein